MRILISIFVSTIFCSCVKHKNMLILNGEIENKSINLTENYDFKYEKNDIIEILLISENKEASELFKTKFEGTSIVTYLSGVAAKGGYTIDANGELNLPFIGTIKASGKTKMELTKEITQKLSEYIKNPVVQINLLNFKISVLGEVKQPGTYNIPNERVTLLQALATCGEFTNFSKKDEIHVIREINGERNEYVVNLNDKSVFSQEVYYLKQNDIVYVPQLKSKIYSVNNQLVLPLVSFTSLVLTALNLILK